MRDATIVAAKANSLSFRLRDTARNRGLDTNMLLKRFALERFLARLVEGPYGGCFALKGGMIMAALTADLHRPTEDIDVTAQEAISEDAALELVRVVAQTSPREEDGLVFDDASLSLERIIEGRIPGARITLNGSLATTPRPTPVRIKLDLAYCSVVLPGPVRRTLPASIPGFEPVTLPCYHWATVVAEKIHAIHRHGADNTRMKDYLDLTALARCEDHAGAELAEATRATFNAWGGAMQEDLVGLSEEFARKAQPLWDRFSKTKAGRNTPSPTFPEVVQQVRAFVLPVYRAARLGEAFDLTWRRNEGWSSTPLHQSLPGTAP